MTGPNISLRNCHDYSGPGKIKHMQSVIKMATGKLHNTVKHMNLLFPCCVKKLHNLCVKLYTSCVIFLHNYVSQCCVIF